MLECRQLLFGLREIAKHKVSFAKVFMRAAVPRIWPPPLVGSTVVNNRMKLGGAIWFRANAAGAHSRTFSSPSAGILIKTSKLRRKMVSAGHTYEA